MDSSNKLKRAARRVVLSAESLEGRQLLSGTTASTPAASTAAVTSTSADPTGMAFPMQGMRFGRGQFGRFGAGGMRGFMDFGGAAMGQTTAPAATTVTAAATTTDASATPATVATATAASPSTPSSGVPMPGPWSWMDGLGWGVKQDSMALAAPTGSTAASATGSTAATQATPATGMQGLTQGGPAGGMMFGGSLTGGGSAMGMRMAQFGNFGHGAGDGSVAGGSSTSTAPSAVEAAFKQLRTDQQAIADKSQVTPALQAALRKDLQTLNTAATTAPDSTKLLALQSDEQTLAGTLPTSDQLATLQADFTAAVASQGVTDTATITKTFTDLGALITATNIGASDVTTLTADLKAVGQSTAAPLGRLGIDLSVLDRAINPWAGSTTTAAATATPATASAAATTTATASAATTSSTTS